MIRKRQNFKERRSQDLDFLFNIFGVLLYWSQQTGKRNKTKPQRNTHDRQKGAHKLRERLTLREGYHTVDSLNLVIK